MQPINKDLIKLAIEKSQKALKDAETGGAAYNDLSVLK
jgi:hypothetical protein